MTTRRPPNTALVLPSASTALSATVNGVKYVAKTYPKTTSYYLIGLVIALLFTGTALTATQTRSYDKTLDKIDTELEYDVSLKASEAYNAYYNSKGWFSCDSTCTRLKNTHEAVAKDLAEVRRVGYEIVKDAKEEVGVFSEVGVAEVRDSFWSYFAKGAKFAKRQSMYDALFMGFRSMGRNESTGEYVMKMVLQVSVRGEGETAHRDR